MNRFNPFLLIARMFTVLAGGSRRRPSGKPETTGYVPTPHPRGFRRTTGAFGRSAYYRRNYGVRGPNAYLKGLPAYRWPVPADTSEWKRKYRTLRKKGVLA